MRDTLRSVFAALALAAAVAAFPPESQAQDSIAILEEAQRVMHRYVIGVRTAPGPTSLTVRHTRPSIISSLEVAGSALPGDDWISGHRIGLQVKEGNLDRALDLALDCRASDWWCAALLGFVLHELEEVSEAERAFDRALERMPRGIRCGWTEDAGLLLDRWGSSAFRGMSCEDAAAAAERMWWLANPLFMESGNDRRTEHFARLVQLRLHDETLRLHDQQCSPDHRWSLLTLGFPPQRWSYERPFVPFETGPGLSFVPPPELLAAPFDSRPGEWRTRPEHRQERYRVRRWSTFHALPAQVAVFPRDGGFAVAAASAALEHFEDTTGLRMVLALSDGPAAHPRILDFETPGAPALFRVEGADFPGLVSLEALGVEAGRAGLTGLVREAGRARFGHRPPPRTLEGLTLSDPLLFVWEEGIPETLESVLPRMLGSLELSTGGEVGVFWEMTGLAPGDPVELSLTAEPDRPGFFRRLGELLRVVERRETTRFTWSESPGGESFAGRALRLDLSLLAAGSYTILLALRTPQESIEATRRIELR